ncbi:YigZ family protein [Bacillus spongiae]|uniref:YigZ family protein n=1 Tax=Bacillus spongiae TaxID=2683610 RepID=A0ABU8HEE3_9BACI
MLERYKTVSGYGEHEILIQKSRFIAYVNRAETEEAAQHFIEQIKKKHWNASHNCSAYLIGERNQIQKANDDGEPNGTAGIPILEVLKKRDLKDTVVVITRYFGGIKLGGGGLIRAYGRATTEGLNITGIIERRLMQVIKTQIEYPLLGKVENEIRSSTFELKEIEYVENVVISTYVEEPLIAEYEAWMTEITNGQALITKEERLYLNKNLE